MCMQSLTGLSIQHEGSDFSQVNKTNIFGPNSQDLTNKNQNIAMETTGTAFCLFDLLSDICKVMLILEMASKLKLYIEDSLPFPSSPKKKQQLCEFR